MLLGAAALLCVNARRSSCLSLKEYSNLVSRSSICASVGSGLLSSMWYVISEAAARNFCLISASKLLACPPGNGADLWEASELFAAAEHSRRAGLNPLAIKWLRLSDPLRFKSD